MDEAQQYLQRLETAGRIILQPSSTHARDAEHLFMEFRKTEVPYSICRYILDHSQQEYVLFESATTLKLALVRDWVTLSQDQKNELRQYLFQFIMERYDILPAYVIEKILELLAIMIKRGGVEDGGQERNKILDEVEKLIFDGDIKKQILGCRFILALMQEYSTTKKSNDVGLTWESHYTEKKSFEVTDLKRIFIFSTRALNAIKNLPQPLLPDVWVMLKHLLKICESVFLWVFVSYNTWPKYLVAMFEGKFNSENSPALKLGSEWKDIITNPSTVDLYFQIYWMVRDNLEYSHCCLICLVQLSSVNGNIWTDTNERIQYFKNYLENLLKLLTTVKILDREAIGISTIIKRLINDCTTSIDCSQFPNLMKCFLEKTTVLTCQFAEEASVEDNMGQDDKKFLEAFDSILPSWVTIFANGNTYFPEEVCKNAALQIFNTYTKCKISPPHGTKTTANDDFNENEENDQIANKEQLQYMGIFGRLIPEHTLPLLVNLLECQIKEYRAVIEQVHNSGSNEFANSVQHKIDAIHEDIHWLFLIAGHVLTVDSEGEPSMIPSEIMQYSIKQSEKVNMDLSLKFLTNQMLIIVKPISKEAVDDVVKLVSIAFHYCELEKTLVAAKMEPLCSPLLSGTLIWFLREFSQAYLMPNETYYNELSMPLLQAFGQHTEAANWVLNFILNKVEFNTKLFLYGDVSLAEDTIGLLVSLVEMRHKAEIIIKCDGFWRLFHLLDDTKIKETMVPEVKEGLYKAFSLAADALNEADQQIEYWTRVITPTLNTFRVLVSHQYFRSVYNDNQLQNDIIDTLHRCIGLASGAVINTVPTIFATLYPTLNDFSSLIGLYHNYQNIVHLIIKLFNEFAKKMLCFLKIDESDKFYASCYQMVEMYAHYNLNRVSLDADAEEQSFEDLYIFLELLMQVMSKEVLDLSSDGRTTTGKTAGDVCVYGLKIVLPLLTYELLRIPTLCSQYFKCVVFMCEMVPLKLCCENENIITDVLKTIEWGLTSYGPEITVLCTDFLQSIASFVHKQEHFEYFPAYYELNKFLKYMMDIILSQEISYDALSSTSNALFSIVSCFPENFETLCNKLLQGQADDSKAQKLQNAFISLTNNIEFNGTHLMKCRFKKNFDTFVTVTRGFLFVK